MNKFFNSNYALDLAKKVSSQSDVVDKAAINQSIECILMTEQYERVFEPNFGSFLSSIVFERLNNDNAEKLLDAIISLVTKYENRITVVSELCAMNVSQNDHMISLKLVYVINSDNSPGEFNKKIVF
jgi:phage baseplate assembly protein W